MDEYEDETQNADPGTAFPIVHPDGRGVQYFGLTMRDYFAAKAMQGLLAEPMWEEDSTAQVLVLTRDTVFTNPADRFASAAYKLADAMLAARTK
ncbi:MAG: hypothetical protein AB1670_07695 [Pseudomonadota bacterium]